MLEHTEDLVAAKLKGLTQAVADIQVELAEIANQSSLKLQELDEHIDRVRRGQDNLRQQFKAVEGLKAGLRSIQDLIEDDELRQMLNPRPQQPEPAVQLTELNEAVKEMSGQETQEAILEVFLQQASRYVERAVLFLNRDTRYLPWKTIGFSEENLQAVTAEDPGDPILRAAQQKRVIYREASPDQRFSWSEQKGALPHAFVCLPVVFGEEVPVVFYGDASEAIALSSLEALGYLAALVLKNNYLEHLVPREQPLPKPASLPGDEGHLLRPKLVAPAVPRESAPEEAPATQPEPRESAPSAPDEAVAAPEQPSIAEEEPAVEEKSIAEEEPAVEEKSIVEEEPAVEEKDEAEDFAAEPQASEPRSWDRLIGAYGEFGTSESQLEEEEVPQLDEEAEPQLDEEAEPQLEEEQEPELEQEEELELEAEEPQLDEEELQLEEEEPWEEPEEVAPDVSFAEALEDFSAETPESVEPVVPETASPAVEERDPVVETAPPAAPAQPEPSRPFDLRREDDEKHHSEARRFARLLVSEIKLYNEDEVYAGRENADLYTRLKRDIDRSREMYERRVNPAVSRTTDYLHKELIRILAKDDEALMGQDYPGPFILQED